MKMTVFFQDFELEEDRCFFCTLAGKQTRKSFS